MIEQNSGHIAFDCGSTYENFNENKLLENYSDNNTEIYYFIAPIYQKIN